MYHACILDCSLVDIDVEVEHSGSCWNMLISVDPKIIITFLKHFQQL